MKNIYILFSLFTIISFGQTNNDNFNTFLKDEQVKNALVSFNVQEVDAVSVINYNTENIMYPASLQKLLTTSTALDVLGPDFKFETKVNFNGIIEGTSFKGVIEVVGSGDPTTDEKLVEEIYEFLVLKNINKVEGYLKVTQEVFDNNVPQSWLVEDVANYYGAIAFSFNYKRNLYKIKLQQAAYGEKPTFISTNPYQRNLSFDNQLISKETNAPDKAYVLGMAFSNKRRIVGSIPSGTGFFTIKGSNNNPAQTFKNELIKKFQKEQFGFVFNVNVANSTAVFEFIHSSKKLSEILIEMNQKSSNLFAEAILKRVAFKKYNVTGSTENGLKVIAEKSKSGQFHFYDGSGMSRKNLINSQLLMNLLKSYSSVDNNPNANVFKASLGVSGVSGTMKYFNSEKIIGKVTGKSGSADGVLNYAGYLTDNKGKEHVFVFMINNYSGDRKVLRRKMVNVLEDLIVN